MPSVYSYHHVELDKVGRGKRVIQPPGGQSADIFGRRNADSVSSILGMSATGAGAEAGSVVVSQVQQQLQGSQVSVNGAQSDTASQSSSRASSVIDGMPSLPILQAEASASQRAVRDNITKSSVFADANQAPKNSPKRTIATIRRNPITGEVYECAGKQ